MGRNKKAQRRKKKEQHNNNVNNNNNNNNNNNSNIVELKHNHHVVSETKDPGKAKGDAFFRSKEYEKAEEAYVDALTRVRKGKEHASINSNLAAVYIIQSRFEKALECAEKAVKTAPEWAKAYIRKGEALFRLCRFDEAREAFAHAVASDDRTDLAASWLKRVDNVQNQLKDAEGIELIGANPDEDKFKNMINWLLEAGATFPLLYMKYYSADSRGVHSKSDIPKNTRIMYIPHSRIMTSEKAKASKIGRKLIGLNVQLRSQHSYLASYLCQEKANPDSEWRPYLNILPEKYRNVPIFFTDDELKELEGSFVLPKIHDRKRVLKEEYDRICHAVPEFSTYATHWDFVWARLVVITRIFGMVIKKHKTDGLVPFADMLNHKIPRETKWTFTDDVDGFIITSTMDMKNGQEVFDSYGRKCNSRFFVNYGFAIENNEDNEAVIRVALRRNDPHYDLKIRMLGGEWYHGNREFQIPASYTKKTVECFSFLRLAQAQGSEEIALLPAQGKIDDIAPMTVRNEIAVLKQLRQAASIVLTQFPTTIEEDEKLLPQQEMFSNTRNCIVMRLGEKKVLQWLIDCANRGIELLEMSWKDLKRVIEKNYVADKSPFNKYVMEVIRPLKKPTGR